MWKSTTDCSSQFQAQLESFISQTPATLKPSSFTWHILSDVCSMSITTFSTNIFTSSNKSHMALQLWQSHQLSNLPRQKGQIWAKSGLDWYQMEQIWNFFRSDFGIFWNLIWKSLGFVPFGANLTHFGAKQDSKKRVHCT